MRPGGRRALRAGATLLVVAALVLFARNVDWRSVSDATRSADPLLLVGALVLNLLSLFCKGVRWWIFLRPIGARSFGLAIRATFAGAALNNVLVAQGGEGARVAFVARGAGVSSAKVLAALALERTLDAVTYLILLVAAAWLLPLPRNIARWSDGASLALVAVVVALGALARRRRLPNGEMLGPSVHDDGRAPAVRAGMLTRIRAYAAGFGASVREMTRPGRLVVAMLLSVTAWVLQIATYDFVARAERLPLPLAGSVTALIVIGVSFLIRATPGNVGIFQLAYLLAVKPFGMPDAPAIAVALLIQAIQVVPTMLAGALAAPGLLRRGGPLPDRRNAVSSGPEP
jgi:uncharacterized protein (TIRG00374 family)